jgi:hypothetical protein
MSTRDSESRAELTPVLSGWNGIARYLGKGIRTIQRWERQFDLPVRRTHEGPKSTVLALPAEIDAWVRAREFHVRKEASRKSERLLLLESLRELRAENQKLRRQLEALRAKRE